VTIVIEQQSAQGDLKSDDAPHSEIMQLPRGCGGLGHATPYVCSSCVTCRFRASSQSKPPCALLLLTAITRLRQVVYPHAYCARSLWLAASAAPGHSVPPPRHDVLGRAHQRIHLARLPECPRGLCHKTPWPPVAAAARRR